jgi:hypothetical protein
MLYYFFNNKFEENAHQAKVNNGGAFQVTHVSFL